MRSIDGLGAGCGNRGLRFGPCCAEVVSVAMGLQRRSRALLALGLVMVCLGLWCNAAQGQTFGEWFKQNSTQKRYLLQQIAALQVYMGVLQGGYGIVNSGLNTIRGITSGELKLHARYINSLKEVNPVIRDDARVKTIMSRQAEMLDAFAGIDLSLLDARNRAYVEKVRALVLVDCNHDLSELSLVITPGKLAMKDDERVKRLDKVYAGTVDRATFVQHFVGDVALVIREGQLEVLEVKNLRGMYEGGN
jgi:hypothetical protein